MISKKVDEHGTIRYRNELGQLHREDGPAIEYGDGNKLWYLSGEELTEQEFNDLLLRKRLQRIMEL